MMKSTICALGVVEFLQELYADAAANDGAAREAVRASGSAVADPVRGFYRGNKAYMAVGPEFGKLLYNLVRMTRARTVVEFGTSYGVSTIHLAAGLRDNSTPAAANVGCADVTPEVASAGNAAKVVTTEFDGQKAERARGNLRRAGLEDLVEFRVGDALETLADAPREIDLVFLDGAKPLYIEVLRLLEPNLKSGCVIVSDNTDHDGMEEFLAYIREPGNGYVSSAILTARGEQLGGHEVTVRV